MYCYATGRVIAGGLALMYLWALESIPELTGINRPEWEPALRLTGLWQPDLIRAMLPMACILVINCIVLNLPKVVEVGLYKLNAVDPHSLKGAWCQPSNL